MSPNTKMPKSSESLRSQLLWHQDHTTWQRISGDDGVFPAL
ncbi:hypothetical protein POX_c03913 [Penicillium oxalicum]|uniref:Uncharacterized protein n=1 Tax=Penicillium oxalicum (strain 114-2 / CGMCC 5302) TaxID=933388 RepID=S7Z4T8_PENO1|nr:hypothetical protein POX_c03913 [Penicillium oxalicum]EPS25535.1 hypothetical protein PDE_00468 [Penicillium oxalicum 114-2]KAI2791058.1 hypothetical protein POX_c03913 [Penicillium oxalicum]